MPVKRLLVARTLWLSTVCCLQQSLGTSALTQEPPSQVPSMSESVQCRMEFDRTISIQYSTFMKSYIEVNDIEYLTQVATDDDYSDQFPIVHVNLCWCSQYFNRPNEYCPEQFDTCKVDGVDGPVTCFVDTHGGSFIRGFWFICVFWFLALAYCFSCTEQGASARALVQRKLCLRCTGAATEEQLILRDIQAMIEQDPDRATWLLRSAFLRERNRHRAQEARLNRRRGRSREQATGGADDVPLNSNANNSLPGWQQTMELRVKRYEGSGADEKHGRADEFSLASASQMLSNVLNFSGLDAADAEEVKCVICLATVQVGDRIGDIPCGHIYCIECLKDWVKRKNQCPLCMRPGLATPVRTSTTDPASPENATVSTFDVDPEEGVEVTRQTPTTPNQVLGLVISMPGDFSETRLEREHSD